MHALVLGAEVECRIGNAVYPAHYDVGWHITGTAGVFGAAAAVGKLLGSVRTADGLGAGPRGDAAGGLREMFGTMTKSFHPGRAAQNGLPRRCWRRELHQLESGESKRSAAGPTCFSTARDYAEITEGLGAALRDFLQFVQAVPLRDRDPSGDRRLHPAAQDTTSTRARSSAST